MTTLHKIAMSGALALAVVAAPAWPEGQLTFTKDVLPIMQENCQVCHRPGGADLSGMIAPMSLITYQEVRPWSKAIARVVASGEMPPWDAHERYKGVFSNEQSLTQDEIDTIVNWVEQGAKRGNPTDAPAPIEWPTSGWSLGEPDLVVGFPEPYFVEDEVEDLYHDIFTELTEEQLPEDKWIKAVEFKMGSDVVHHIIAHANAPGDKSQRRGMIGGNAPGNDQTVLPEGFGIKIKKGSTIRFAMHYHKEAGPGTGVWDDSKLGIQFQEGEVRHPITINTIDHGKFEIPPYAERWRVGASHTFDEDVFISSMMPHMHLRGTYAKYTAYYPDGTSEELLEVPEWDFNWQRTYDYKVMKQVPAGTRVEMEFHFDNSAENAEASGFNAARAIRFGGPTTDEMDLAWITYAPVEPIDLSKAEPAEQTGD